MFILFMFTKRYWEPYICNNVGVGWAFMCVNSLIWCSPFFISSINVASCGFSGLVFRLQPLCCGSQFYWTWKLSTIGISWGAAAAAAQANTDQFIIYECAVAGGQVPALPHPQHRNRLSLNKFPTATLRKLKGNMKVRDQRRDLYGDGYILFGNVKYIFIESFDTHFSKR